MSRAIAGDENGNLNYDFLVGLVIFMTAFLYLINSVPGFFTPYQTNAIDLGSVAYRTSAILAEDPGWYIDSAQNISYSDWELVGSEYLSRVGLAMDKRMPNVLSLKKIFAFQGLDYIKSRYTVGLNGTISYNYSLVIKRVDNSRELLNITNPAMADNMNSIDRMVLIREGEGLFIDASQPSPDGFSFYLPVGKNPRFEDTNATIRLFNFTSNPFSTKNLSVIYYIGPYYGNPDYSVDASYAAHDFYIYRDNTYVTDYVHEPYYPSDKIDIVVNATQLRMKSYSIYGLNVSRFEVYANLSTSPLPSGYQDYNKTNEHYQYFDTPGIMNLKVWQC